MMRNPRFGVVTPRMAEKCILAEASAGTDRIVALRADLYGPGAGIETGAAMATSGLSAVFLASRGPLLRFLRARGAGDDSEDLLQELWFKIRNISTDGPIADPTSYLFRMADNLMHDRVRANSRRGRREEVWSDITGDENSSHGVPFAERSLLARERLRRVEAALAPLGDRSRAIFWRFRIEGMGQSQIAREEGISLSAVEKHLQRAYRAIMQVAQEDARSDEPGTGEKR